MSTFDELSHRVADLEKRQLALEDLPIRALKRYLEQNWQPEAKDLLLPGSIKPSNLAQFPVVTAYIAVDQQIPDATPTAVTWSTTVFGGGDWDPYDMWNTINPTRITVNYPGFYLAISQSSWNPNAAGWRMTRHLVNGGSAIGAVKLPSTSAAQFFDYTTMRGGNLKAGDYVEMVVEQTSGGPLDLDSSSAFTLLFAAQGRFSGAGVS